MKLIFLAVILATATQSAHAYPIFFSCRDDKSLSEVLTPKELAQQLTKLATAKRKSSNFNSEKAIGEACQGLQQCIADFQRLVSLAKLSNGAARDELLKQIEAKAEKTYSEMKSILPVPSRDMEFFEKYNKVETQVYECNAAKEALPPETLKNGDKCTVGNFHHSPYMFVNGVRISGEADGENRNTTDIACSSIDRLVDEAVAMGQDPYTVLSIAMMENGTQIDSLYLDPVGEVEALGCTNTQVKSKAEANLESFQTYYKVDFKVVDNKSLAQKLENYAKLKGQIKDTPSYVCSGQASQTVEQPIKNACCLKVPFSGNLDQALIHSSLQKYIKAPVPQSLQSTDSGELSARRIQRFNGYTHLMGGAESVSVWRSGVDYYKTPAYGYQTMDFYLNSVATNPYIKAKVKAAEDKLGVHSPSTLCLDLPAGAYSVDHNYFFNKHANSPRMSSIKSVWDSGDHKLSSLSQAQLNVLQTEVFAVANARSRKIIAEQLTQSGTKISPEELVSKLGDVKSSATAARPRVVLNQAGYEFYMKNILPLRNTVAKASSIDQGYTWKDMTDEQFNSMLNAVKTRH